MPRFLRNGLAVALAALAFSACKKNATSTSADAEAEPKIDFAMGAPVTDSSIVAIATSAYGTDTLTAAQFGGQLAQIIQQNPSLLADSLELRELRRKLVEGFVLQNLVAGEARRTTGLAVDTAAISSQISGFMQQLGGPEGFAAQLQRDGLTVDSLRNLLGQNQQQEALAKRWGQAATQPTLAEIEAYRHDKAQEVRAQHIVFRPTPGATPAQKDSVERIAAAVLDSAKKGTDFAGLARRHGQDGTAATGGDLNWFSKKSDLDKTFLDAAFALRDSGDVTAALVRTKFGLHVIRLTGRRETSIADTAATRLEMLAARTPNAIRTKLRDLVRERNVKVRVNPALFQADLNAPKTD